MIVILLMLSSVYISYKCTGVLNPISTISGLMEVSVFNNDFKEIQNNPKVVIANPNYGIEIYMQSMPYKAEFCDVARVDDQILYTYNVGEGQEIIEQIEYGPCKIWKWR